MGLTGLVTSHHRRWGDRGGDDNSLKWPIDMRSLPVNFQRGDNRDGKERSGSVVHWEAEQAVTQSNNKLQQRRRPGGEAMILISGVQGFW